MRFNALAMAAYRAVGNCAPVALLTPLILANPVIGMPLNYTLPGYSGPVTSQQWYRNTGSGPVLIPGATGSSYTPTLTSTLGTSDVGGFFSVQVNTPFGSARSQEFSASGSVISQSSVLTATSPTSGNNFIATEATTITLLTVTLVRLVCPLGPNPTFYIETLAAPGTYAGGTSFFGDPTLLGGSQFSSNTYSRYSLSSAACIDQVAAKPTTATRPGTSTGVGFFTKNGAVYDANGHIFNDRGINRLHWDCNRPGNDTGLFNAKANSHRLFIDTSQDWTTVNKPLMDAMVSNSVVPQPVIPYVRANFQATFSGTVMTVTSMNSGVIGCAPSFSAGAGGGFISTGVSSSTVIKNQLTNTNGSGIPGKEGTYTTSTSNSIATPQNVVYSNGTTGQKNPDFAIAAAQVWVDQVANWQPYERWMILNVLNEWGASANTYTASISGTTMTVPSSSASVYLGQKINGSGVTPCTVVAFLTGTGANGTYTVDVSQTAASTTMTDVTWRDTCITMIGMLRTAGYLGTIVFDAPGSGQDAGTQGRAWTIINHAAAILAADPQANIKIELHAYGSYQAGALAATAQAMATAAVANNIPYSIGEFGPANENAASGSITTAQTLETISVAYACGLGWKDWAWDDPVTASQTTGQIYYADCFQANSNFYSTLDPTQLTTKGQQVLLDPVYGLATLAVPATVFP